MGYVALHFLISHLAYASLAPHRLGYLRSGVPLLKANELLLYRLHRKPMSPYLLPIAIC